MDRTPWTKTLEWIGGVEGYLRLVDQRHLPGRLEYLDCRELGLLWEAIRTLAVRGAPAIGVTAGYGLVLALQAGGGGSAGETPAQASSEQSAASSLEGYAGQIQASGSSAAGGQASGRMPSTHGPSHPFAGRRDATRSTGILPVPHNNGTPLLRSGGITSVKEGLDRLAEARDYLASSRPTAVNLFWALDRVVGVAMAFAAGKPQCSVDALRERVLAEAQAICDEDIEMCRRIGVNGMRFIVEGAGVLTHCNAGALATAGQGTALSPMFEAHRAGRRFKVYADETRPLLQGARLTAWELRQAGIDVTLLCDNMAAWLMKQGKVQCVITGADRIAANGDTANKIGTYGLSVLARRHGVPFYVAAPSSTFDLSLADGGRIPIEQRCADEVVAFAGVRTAPDGVGVYNPAFDVTDAGDIAAIITERGVIERPTAAKVAKHLRDTTRNTFRHRNHS